MLSLQEPMAKKPLTQISFAFEDLGAAPEESSVSPIVTSAVPATPAPALPENSIQPQETPTVGIRSIRKKGEATVNGKRGRKSVREMNARVDQLQVPADEELFKKQYYTIGEVAKMFQENQSLIRYWESEFDILQPKKNKKGDRYFRPIDVKNLVLIYDLLRRRKFTIQGARDFLKKNKKAEEKFSLIQSLQQLRSFLVEIRSNL